MRGFFLLSALMLASCAGPPAGDYVGGSAAPAGAGVALGANASGEACTQQVQGNGADIFCGSWQQPSAQVRRAPTNDALAALATDSPWRSALDRRYTCAAPTPTSILGDVPALVLSCTRRVGGWPQVAMVASVGGTAYLADGILPNVAVLGRAIGVLSGRISAPDAPSLPPGRADSLLAARLAAQSFGAGDVGQYEQLMLAGTRANLAEGYVAAEQAFRAAAALQQKALGERDPNVAVPLMHLALQVSNEGQYPEADALFTRAANLAPRAADPAAVAKLLHYRALHEINQHHDAAALVLLRRAEAAYAELLPADMLAPGTAGNLRGSIRLPEQQTALVGVIETRRYQAIALRGLGRPAESEAAVRAAVALAQSNGLRQPILTARLYRTVAMAGAGADDVLGGLSRSSRDFSLALPGTRPLAQTELLRAAEAIRRDQPDAALGLCRTAMGVLRELKAGTSPDLLEPCLALYAARAEASPSDRQHLLAEMFEASQMAQGSITSQQIAQATARLGENQRDPRVGAAIRRRQDVGLELAELNRQRDAVAQLGRAEITNSEPLPTAEELDRRIAAAQGALADADSALQAASPNYSQLVQQVATAPEVLGALAPGEAFAAIALTSAGGWSFVLRDGSIDAARVGASGAEIAALVKRVRAGIELDDAGAVPRFDAQAASTLYTAILGGLDARLRDAGSIVVAPTGPLLSLPFGVLLTGPGNADDLGAAPWLLRRSAIAHVPAAANFVSLRRIAGGSRGTRPWFGFGDFRPVTLAQAERSFPRAACQDSAKLFAGLPPLPLAKRELDAARALLGGTDADELLGAQYTADNVRRADLKSFRVLHFASHALLPSELRCQGEAAIVTSAPAGAADAGGALLTASGVMGLQLDADVVVLSACNSGGPGGTTAGESLSGLARAFFYAGARALMVTHWSVNDQAAAFIVADTLRRMQAGTGVSAALRDAQLGMLSDAGRGLPVALAHPFYWAPFALIGEGRSRTVTARNDAVPAGTVRNDVGSLALR
jgi:CHAT domain-containing protein